MIRAFQIVQEHLCHFHAFDSCGWSSVEWRKRGVLKTISYALFAFDLDFSQELIDGVVLL